MTLNDLLSQRQVFHLKTDLPPNRLRHDIVMRGNLVYRYSRLAEVDLAMGIEQGVIDRALAAGVPAVPVMTKHDGRATYQIMRRARGQPVAELPLEQKRVVWTELAAALRKLHSVTGTSAGLVLGTKTLSGAYSAWELYVKDLVCEHALYALSNQLIDTKQSIAILDHIGDWEQEPPQTEGALLHGDLNDHNVFALDGHLSDIIDWEDALIGDPVFELASWAAFMAHAGEEHEFITAYYADSKPPADFAYRFAVYFLRISLSRLVQLHRYGYDDLSRAKTRLLASLLSFA